MLFPFTPTCMKFGAPIRPELQERLSTWTDPRPAKMQAQRRCLPRTLGHLRALQKAAWKRMTLDRR